MKKLNKDFLQKYVDHKLNSIRVDCDDLTDYLENYTDDKCWVDENLIKKFGMAPQDFLKFDPRKKDINDAIKKSTMLNVLAERYKKAIVRDTTTEIYNLVGIEQENLSYDAKQEMHETKRQALINSAYKKLENAKLTKQEKEALNLESR